MADAVYPETGWNVYKIIGGVNDGNGENIVSVAEQAARDGTGSKFPQ